MVSLASFVVVAKHAGAGDHIAPALQLPVVLRNAVGRQMRRSSAGGIKILSNVAVFG